MRYGRYGLPYVLLRFGLGLTFLLVGVDIFRHPDMWIGYVPPGALLGIGRETLLSLGGLFDVVVGLMLLLRVWTKLAGALAAAHLIGIMASNMIDAVLVRDIGLLGAALALAFWPNKYHKSKKWPSWPRWGRGESEE